MSAVKGVYQGKLALLDKKPPEGYTLRVVGSGRPGVVKGEGRLLLTDEDGGTRVTIRGEAQVGGVIAAVGQRLLGAASRMLMEQFFSAMEAEIVKTPSL